LAGQKGGDISNDMKYLFLAIFGLGFSFFSFAAPAPKGKVLVIISSQTELPLQGGKKHATGYYFNELTVPVRKIVESGYEVVFANPLGNASTMDKSSDSAEYFGKDEAKYKSYKAFHDGLTGLKQPQKLSKVVESGLDQYNGVFFPGGHAPMIDLVKDANVGKVLAHFHEKGKPTVLICHAPVALIAALPNAEQYVAKLSGKNAKWKDLTKDWIYSGYNMTVFSTAEEKIAENTKLGGKVLFYPEDALRAAGGKLEQGKEWQSNVVQDRELITGQNPNSDEKLSEIFVKALEQVSIRP